MKALDQYTLAELEALAALVREVLAERRAK
jgi:hypothetical protein